VKKDRALSKMQVEEQLDEQDMDVEIINDFKQFYQVNFRKQLFTDQDVVSYDVSINPNI
jgi:hypothetical protein